MSWLLTTPLLSTVIAVNPLLLLLLLLLLTACCNDTGSTLHAAARLHQLVPAQHHPQLIGTI
jgi:hypothetical protein